MIYVLPRLFSAFLSILFLGLMVSQSAQARNYWQPAVEPYNGAMTCPIAEKNSGNMKCFALACKGDQPIAFRLLFAGSDLPEGTFPVQVIVNGELVEVLNMHNQNSPYLNEAMLAFSPDKHAALIEKLTQGSTAKVVVGKVSDGVEMKISLKRSGTELYQALKSCPKPAAVQAEMFSQDPVAEARLVHRAKCETAGGRLRVYGDFATEVDVSGDGRVDLILDTAGLLCEGADEAFCADDQCTQHFHIALGDGYQEVLETKALGWEKVAILGANFVVLALDGAACGKDDLPECFRMLRWNGQEFVQD